ncbi:hypothetical protein IG631_15537 [Alternaria alternata]|nr:hypothetical protein IG631_15537 [Alternaria alternata]
MVLATCSFSCSCLCPPNVVMAMSCLGPFLGIKSVIGRQRRTSYCTPAPVSVAARVEGIASGVLCWRDSRDTWRVSAQSNSASRLPDTAPAQQRQQ